MPSTCISPPPPASRKRPRPRPRTLRSRRLSGRALALGLAVVAFAVPLAVEIPGLSAEGHRVLGILLAAIVLWVSEAIPLHATAALIILGEILTVSSKSLLPLSPDYSAPGHAAFYHCLASPVLMLFLGGFFLADGAAKFDLDRNLARVLLRPFGSSPRWILLGLMLVTAIFSMFMSNTATTATMMAVVLPVIAQLPKGDPLRSALALCIPVAANVGGIGTPVGTPPNAIALGQLASAGIHIGFLDWMLMALPIVALLLCAAWLILLRVFPSRSSSLVLRSEGSFDRSARAWIFYVTFAGTVLLWLTEPLHGMSASVVGFVPVVLLLATGVFTTKDFQSVQWHVLWLLAGGIALGVGLAATGLDQWIVTLVAWDRLSPFILIAVLSLVAMALGTFISHTATANVLVPMGMSLAMSGVVSISPLTTGVFIAVGSSLAMALPVSTPPNAIAMSTGAVRVRQMALVGGAVGLLGWLLFITVAPPYWRWIGVLPS